MFRKLYRWCLISAELFFCFFECLFSTLKYINYISSERYLDSHNWKIYRLDADEKDRIPNRSGVYSLLIQPGIANHPACSYLMYIGKTESLRRRFMNYLDERKRETGRPKIFRLLNKYKDYMCFCYTTVRKNDLSDVEDNLLISYIPPNNDRFPAEISRLTRAF